MEQNDDRILDFELNSNFFSIFNNETNFDEFLFNPYENIDVKCQYFDTVKGTKYLKKSHLNIKS